MARFLIVLLPLLCFFSSPIRGFFPTKWKEVVFGFGGVSHVEMTEKAFEDRAAVYFPLNTPISRKMTKARDDISSANADVDENQTDAHWHCDGESFDAAQARITTLKNEAIAALQGGDATTGRHKVGEALHTIQDFYAHSNWVELGNSAPNSDLIRGNPITYASFTTPTCTQCTVISPFFPSDIMCSAYDCAHNTDGFRLLTSGYYFGENVPPAGTPIPSYKCHHGGFTDTPLGSTIGFLFGSPNPGINKDSLNCDWSPHYSHHSVAVAAATEATKQYFDDIKAALNNDHQLRLLFGVGPTIAFAIDTTGSMGDIIASVRQQTIDIASSLVGTPDEPGTYVVSPFNDPFTGPVTVTADINVFKSTVLSLGASGGGDCPELAIQGMLNAVDVMEEQSTLFMFTDAAPKDIGLVSNLISIAVEKSINVYPYKFDSDCDDGIPPSRKLKAREDSVADRYFGEIATATGGQYHTGPRTEVANISSILESFVVGDSSTILRVVDSLDASNSPKTFSVPVDSYMTKVTFLFRHTGINTNVTITQPDSKPLDKSAANVTQTVLSDSVFISIPNPQHGEYIVTIAGTGNYTLTCRGVSTLHLSSFSFATVRGRVGHTGWYPIPGPPPYNKPVGALADIDGPFTSADFSFRSPSFELIASPPMKAGSGEFGFPPSNAFFTILIPPPQSFSVYVAGIDKGGNKYQRVLDSVFVPISSNLTYPLGGNQTFPANMTTASIGTSTTMATSSAKWENATSMSYTTRTIYSTRTSTITSCPPEVHNCPGRVTTEIIPITTTVCPVTNTPATTTAPSPLYTTSTIYSTTSYTITACPNSGSGCPELGSVTTKRIPVTTTVCPISPSSPSATKVGTSSTLSGSSPTSSTLKVSGGGALRFSLLNHVVAFFGLLLGALL